MKQHLTTSNNVVLHTCI